MVQAADELVWFRGDDQSQIELLPVVLHELGHGLGFSTTTSGQTGSYNGGFPHIYDRFLLDNVLGLHWDQMTAAERVTSATACTRLVWDGFYATSQAPAFLADKPLLRINSPGPIAGDYEAGVASFGPALSSPGVTGNVVLANGLTVVTPGVYTLAQLQGMQFRTTFNANDATNAGPGAFTWKVQVPRSTYTKLPASAPALESAVHPSVVAGPCGFAASWPTTTSAVKPAWTKRSCRSWHVRPEPKIARNSSAA